MKASNMTTSLQQTSSLITSNCARVSTLLFSAISLPFAAGCAGLTFIAQHHACLISIKCFTQDAVAIDNPFLTYLRYNIIRSGHIIIHRL